MKTSQDPRHLKRVQAVQELFAWEFSSENKPKSDLAIETVKHLSEIDEQIKKAALAWPINQINKVDLSILRLAVFELIIKKDAPIKVIVDEAVELAKEYGSELSPSFINGVLGSLITLNNLEKNE